MSTVTERPITKPYVEAFRAVAELPMPEDGSGYPSLSQLHGALRQLNKEELKKITLIMQAAAMVMPDVQNIPEGRPLGSY